MHLTEAEIAQYVEAGLTAAQEERVRVHCSQCDRCRAQLAALARLPRVLETSDAPALDERAFARALAAGSSATLRQGILHRTTARFALAATILLLLGVSYVLLEAPTPERFRDRSSENGSWSLVPEDGGAVAGSPPTLRWSRLRHSIGYIVSVHHQNGTLLYQGRTTDTLLALPDDIRLEPGETYLWSVSGFLPDRSTRQSPLNVFRYVP